VVAAGQRVMDRWVEDRLVDWTAGTSDKEFKAQLRRELAEVAAELAGAAPTPIEATLCRTAALCWFALRTAEAQHAAYAKSDGATIPGAEFRQRRIDHAHRRFLATLKTLATVRRLALPTLQLTFRVSGWGLP
jgi:predicted alpha-1,6-mannanase (GH76 family)